MAALHSAGNSITIRDVASRAGVSLATVSRVLNNNASIRPETRAAVLKAVAFGLPPKCQCAGAGNSK